jgi:hypothetical protein
MDEGLLYDLCSRARRVQAARSSEASLRGLTDLVRAAADPRGRRSDLEIHQLIESAPQPVGMRWSVAQLEALAGARGDAPAGLDEDEAEDYEKAQAALLRMVGKDDGEPASGPVRVAKNVLEQLLHRWF